MTRGILSVCHGPDASKKIVLEPGKPLRIGRSDLADIAVRGDAQMSGAHFELGWDGETCTLRDLDSATGTLVGGQRVAEAPVPHGGWIRAGQTDFLFHVEDFTPPPEADENAPLETWDETDGEERALVTLGERAAEKVLYAVVDPTRDERILVLLRECVDRCQSLYEGVEGLTMAEVAPHLVDIEADSNFLGRLVVEGFGNRWAIFIVSEAGFVAVRRHLRRLLMVESGTGEPMYFRFYDPRVLAAFLPTCTLQQRADVFGDIDAFLVEGPGHELLTFPRETPLPDVATAVRSSNPSFAAAHS